MMKKKKSHLEIIFTATIITSVCSQIDILSSIMRPIMYALWVLTLLIELFNTKGKLTITSTTKKYSTMYVMFLFFCLLCSIKDDVYLESNYLRILLIPLLVVFFIDICPSSIVIDYQFYAKVFVLSAIFFAVYFHMQYITSYSYWLTARTYLFAQKNSAAQIWMCAILLCWFIITPKRKAEKVFWYIVSLYLLFISGLSQCRTAILALGVGVIVLVLFRSKHKVRWICFFGVIILFVFLNPATYQYINHALLLERYADVDLNTFSSGRLDNYVKAINAFKSSPIIGNGVWYVDCSYLSILAESGIVGFAIIEPLWIYIIIRNFVSKFNVENGSNMKNFTVVITVFYLIESIFEGFPPFGPGVSALGFWLFTGLLMRYKKDSYTVV